LAYNHYRARITKNTLLKLEVNQINKGLYYRFPLEFALVAKNVETVIKTLQIDSANKQNRVAHRI
jgi:hypothetical protein